jgi:hypothetical protein
MRPPLALRILPSVAYRAWFRPPLLGPDAAQRDTAAVAGLEPFSISAPDGATVSGHELGEGPLALALHGWGGRSGQLSEVVRRLAGEGLRAAAVDLPGRAGGRPTDVKQVAAAIAAAGEVLGPPAVVVAHSFAALALRLVSWDPVPPLVIMAAPMVKVSDALDGFSRRAHLAPWVDTRLRRRLQMWDPEVFERVNGSAPDQLPGADVLILHDPEDGDTSFASSAELAALRPGTSLIPLPGTGHNGILRHPASLHEMAGFVAASREGLRASIASSRSRV